ncbi:hypothetical protein [Parvularcula marina]|uniref:Uncharacterized protein n=1 Tax=Parvularcula marina TaxID=2292771 RepID=A0A371RHT9_9PROT|nr:hypothetical protein [Parvularcula marina]RFB04995.1 hypothetical protein DX908_06650 [Parvularcula marina]
MNAMTSASPRAVTRKTPVTAWASVQALLALTALMLGVALAGVALIVASVAVPLGLMMQFFAGDAAPKTRRGWQAVTA